ncbi:MAG: aldehyde dehydrogenase family protein [Candidatus Marithrix sp.]|nr:aldehyde dehydrogenase family protein [Candidatus Marithrix sp.]
MQNSNITIAVSQNKLSKKVADFIAKDKQMLINGKWVNSVSGKTFPVYDPATAKKIVRVAEGNRQDIDLAVKSARNAFDNAPWTTMTAMERSRIIWKIGELMYKYEDELAELESIDNGKSKSVAKTVDIPLSADHFLYYAGWPTKIEGTTIPLSVPYASGQHFHAYTRKEPVGVIGQIIPWNFPLLMLAMKVGPALAAGNTIILKPAEETPLTALRMGEIMQEAGLPDGVINIVPGYGETAGASLAAHDNVDKVAFTGSTEVGKLIVQAAAGNLKKVSLELGGKSPTIIFNDVVDVDAAIAGAANAIFFNHGQVCTASSRIYVERDIFEQISAGIADYAKNIRLGSGLDEKTQMGPLVSQTQFDRVTKYISSGINDGAQVLAGSKVDSSGYFVAPTVLTNTNPDMQIIKEEIFGPVLAIEPFDDAEELMSVANNTEYGLAAAIWTSNLSKAHLTAAKLKAGTVWINTYHVYDAAMPFGGYKQSGWGREMGHEAIDLYTQTKSVCIAL